MLGAAGDWFAGRREGCWNLRTARAWVCLRAEFIDTANRMTSPQTPLDCHAPDSYTTASTLTCLRPDRLAVRTPASHVGNTGSIPVRGANKINGLEDLGALIVSAFSLLFLRKRWLAMTSGAPFSTKNMATHQRVTLHLKGRELRSLRHSAEFRRSGPE